ncbi:MAG TPA: XRE family transcriptional regulator [Bauldia sp.]|nr:XRE family transcriptional regulator [Bauldia sp.]
MSDVLEAAKAAGNLRDLGTVGATATVALKQLIAARIGRLLRERHLTVRGAEKATGFAAADFSRIGQGKLGRFTVDRLMAILGKLDPAIEMSIILRPALRRDWVTGRLREREAEMRARGIDALYLFGSVARDEAGPESDVDVLLDVDERRFKAADAIGIGADLQATLGVPVNVVDRRNVREALRASIERDARRVF